MSEPVLPQADAAQPATAVPVTPDVQAEVRVAGEPRSFRDDAAPYTFIMELRDQTPRDKDRVSRR
ncbi:MULTISPECIES: hypothetical protein [unclassified Caulobacter]|uniref:hypothetical protein n=1 Tax=unclassified Caulobacter TaxID=2648921 RepID=UPI0013CB8996|nr:MULTISPECIES: hypothetical protein [unclassified Caulobacter]MBC6982546.1 hypothetical protein [Caulobacter sp. 17J80-11]NEX94273.1 hypothetical protein [Caulobacter sp. 17J65-9]